MNCCNEQIWDNATMACPAKSHGHGRRAQETRRDMKPSTSETHIGRKFVEILINEVTEAYCEGTNEGIHKILEEWEYEVKHVQTDPKHVLVNENPTRQGYYQAHESAFDV